MRPAAPCQGQHGPEDKIATHAHLRIEPLIAGWTASRARTQGGPQCLQRLAARLAPQNAHDRRVSILDSGSGVESRKGFGGAGGLRRQRGNANPARGRLRIEDLAGPGEQRVSVFVDGDLGFIGRRQAAQCDDRQCLPALTDWAKRAFKFVAWRFAWRSWPGGVPDGDQVAPRVGAEQWCHTVSGGQPERFAPRTANWMRRDFDRLERFPYHAGGGLGLEQQSGFPLRCDRGLCRIGLVDDPCRLAEAAACDPRGDFDPPLSFAVGEFLPQETTASPLGSTASAMPQLVWDFGESTRAGRSRVRPGGRGSEP